MTKRILVVDCGYFGSKSDFQYAIVDVNGDYKYVSKYHCIEGQIHSSSLARMIEEIFEENKCDEIHIDGLGTGFAIIDCISKKYHDKVMISKSCALSNHEAICDLIQDLQRRQLFINKDSMELYSIIEYIGRDGTLYSDQRGLYKIGRGLDFNVRRKIQLILGLYICV